MTANATNAVWGSPLFQTRHLEGSYDSSTVRPIGRQLRTFVGEQIERFHPEIIIVVERKGTAILRALTERASDPLRWSWTRVLSSSVVGQLPDDFFKTKRILIFDDMMRTGKHLTEVLDQLWERRLWELTDNNVKVAVFAVHERGFKELSFHGQRIPHSWFYRDLPTSAYQEVRAQIIEMLQAAGSLMLDTEHIEVRLRLRDSVGHFLEALRRRAQAVWFKSLGERTNITVYYPDDEAHRLPAECFPEGAKLEGIVKKCRIVHRRGDEFAIIPICYPGVPDEATTWPTLPTLKELFERESPACGEALFYAVGLIAALQIVRWTIRDLAAYDPSMYTISLPSEPGGSLQPGGYTLDHLRVMYPALNVRRLTHLIAQIENDATTEGGRLKGRKFDRSEEMGVTDEELRQNAAELLQVIRFQLDEEILNAARLTGTAVAPHPSGLTAQTIFSLAREKFGWENIRTSVLFDMLIDGADLVPHVERRRDDDGRVRLVRTFEPDGEMVSELVRRLTTQWGMPPGF